MRALILAIVGGVVLAAVSAQAAPPPPKPSAIELGAAPPAELVRDGCGRGWRHHWRDQWGYWRWGDCAPDEGRPYGGYGAGTYYPPPVWSSAPAPWGWGW